MANRSARSGATTATARDESTTPCETAGTGTAPADHHGNMVVGPRFATCAVNLSTRDRLLGEDAGCVSRHSGRSAWTVRRTASWQRDIMGSPIGREHGTPCCSISRRFSAMSAVHSDIYAFDRCVGQDAGSHT